MTNQIDLRTFWRMVGQRAVGASVVTAEDDRGPAGFLGLSATHLSAEPPLMMVCVDQRTSALRTILDAGSFAINYLPRDAQEIADVFGGKAGISGADRFVGRAWTTGLTGAPLLEGAVCSVECRLEDTVERGSTTIVIGRVVDVRSNDSVEPLIFFRGRYLP